LSGSSELAHLLYGLLLGCFVIAFIRIVPLSQTKVNRPNPLSLPAMASATPAPVPTPCAVCGKTLPSKSALRVHNQTCKANFACEQCTAAFRNITSLREHQKTHRVRFLCDQCDTEPFFSQARLDDHKRLGHGGEHRCTCGKSYSSADHLKRHMKACTATGPSLVCDCGAALQDMKKFNEHQERCVLSRPGATAAVKRRFEEVEGDDREAAALQALGDVAAAARAKLAMTCARCGVSFNHKCSLKRHREKMSH